jgi:hypothetical protein
VLASRSQITGDGEGDGVTDIEGVGLDVGVRDGVGEGDGVGRIA